MILTKNYIQEQIEQAFEKGYLMIKDHRQNRILLDKGVFSVNDCIQPKTKDSIKAIFLEAFRLTRDVHINDTKYFRKKGKWVTN